ncbi:MAG: hypothetical protein ACXW4P_21795 [Thermoanaerobaculia bacterium]
MPAAGSSSETTYVPPMPSQAHAATTEIARDLLQMRDAVGRITQLKVRSPKPTRVFVFASERGFAPYREAILRRKEPNIRGIFLGAEAGNFIVMKRDNAEDIDRTVYHELTHYFVRNTVAGLPLWASEGIAEYYSTFRTAGDSVHVRHRRRLRSELQLSQVRRGTATCLSSRTTVSSTAMRRRRSVCASSPSVVLQGE